MCKRILIATILFIITFMLVLTGCGSENNFDPNAEGLKIAVEPSTPEEKFVDKHYPNATKVFVDSAMSGMMSVKTGKVDAYLGEDLIVAFAMNNGFDGVEVYDDSNDETMDIAIAISKKTDVEDAEDQVNAFINEVKNNGVYEDMYRRWVVDQNYDMPDIDVPTDSDITINVATSGLNEPFTFMEGEEITGFDVELAKRFAAYAGYNLKIDVYDWSGLYTAIGTSRADYAFSHIYAVDSAKENITFSDSYMEVGSVLVVRADEGFSGFISDIKRQLVNDFVEGGGWKLIGKGLLMTLEITLLALIIGTVLGCLLCILKRNKYSGVRKVTNLFTRIVQGIPLLVLLLLIYYVICTSLSPFAAAVVAFTINFGAYISDAMKESVEAVDAGQWEAAYALGFTRSGAFRRIVLPQTVRNLMPGYRSNAVALVLLTSVVGYVSAMDLTYATQMIRQRTYDAIFPLLVVAIIYILLTLGLSVLIERLVKHSLGKHALLNGVNRENKYSSEINYNESFAGSNNSDEVLIDVNNLTMAFANVTPLKNLNCQVRRGEVISIIGPSGTGKSTLIRCINRLQTPTEGSIKIFGEEIGNVRDKELPHLRRHMGMVFQHFNLFDHMTNIENIMLAQVYVQGKSKQEAYDYGMYLLRAVGLADKADDYPATLSGGQKQRIAIVRTLATNPDIILLDEPTSALDPKMVDEVLILINKLKDMGMTMMVVTHEMRLAQSVASRVFYMDQGIVYEDGTPKQIFQNPKTDRCRSFVRNHRTYNFEITDNNFDFLGETNAATEFAQKYYLSKEQTVKIYQLMEELCFIHIYPRLEADEKLEFNLEYEEKTNECEVEINWTGKEYHVLEEADEVSLAIIRSNLKEISYQYEDGINGVRIIF